MLNIIFHKFEHMDPTPVINTGLPPKLNRNLLLANSTVGAQNFDYGFYWSWCSGIKDYN